MMCRGEGVLRRLDDEEDVETESWSPSSPHLQRPKWSWREESLGRTGSEHFSPIL